MQPQKIILASQSQARIQLLKQAGLMFEILPAGADEVELKRKHSKQSAPDLAQLLATEKALSISRDQPSEYILGADQTLSCNGKIFNKPNSMAEASEQLQYLCGKTHQLHSAIAIVKNHTIVFEHVETAKLSMRSFSMAFLESYLETVGLEILNSVGCYHYEDRGIQLFDHVEGEFSTILGLPLLPLLAFFRQEGIIAT